MNTMEPYITLIINHFEKIIPLNTQEKAYVTEAFQPRLYRKKQYILQEYCKHLGIALFDLDFYQSKAALIEILRNK